MVQHRRHLRPTGHSDLPIRKLNVRSAAPEAFRDGEAVAVVDAAGVEGFCVVGLREGADRAVTFSPCGAFVGSEEAGFGAFVGWVGVADVLGYGERR